MHITEALIKYFQGCPFIDHKRIGLDFLSSEAISYTISIGVSTPNEKIYTNGQAIKGIDFNFDIRQSYGDEVRENIENYEVHTNLIEWIESNNKQGILPEISKGTPLNILVNTSPYLFLEGEQTAVYRIQCRLRYLSN